MTNFDIGHPDHIVGKSNSNSVILRENIVGRYMARIKLKPKVVRTVCNNCLQQAECIRDENGIIKYKCVRCGTLIVSKVLGRRHIQLDLYAPSGQELIEEDI